jgi:hypothetical protein
VTALVLPLLGLSTGTVFAEPPRVKELRVQKVKDTTYFYVRFGPLDEVNLQQIDSPRSWWQMTRPHGARLQLARLPQLVPQDDNAQSAYVRLTISPPSEPGGPLWQGSVTVDGLEFFGKAKGTAPAKFLLLYPTTSKTSPGKNKDKDQKDSALSKLLAQQGSWGQLEVSLDMSLGKKVPIPVSAAKRKANESPGSDDLEGQWAAAQAACLAVLEAQSREVGFYGFAREATGRKYHVPAPALAITNVLTDPELIHRRLFETTTAAAAIAESLALHRMRNANFRVKEDRTIDIRKVEGITIAEHPWVKMMAGRKPTPEPLAKMVPHDNYYIHFKSIRKFIEFSELLDQWGTTFARAYEVNSRDYRLKERLEQQICLKSTGLGKTLGPLVVKSMAVTGSDGYLREGSDVTVIFHVVSKELFRTAVDPFLQQARKKFGKELDESKSDYHKVKIESFVTPLREVSLHRAAFDDFIVYGNSLAGVRRVLDAYQGRSKALWDSLDFQYMRTVFRLEDKREDGFLFLSDPFIRNLVGPAVRIKEKRRLEGLTSMYMVTHGAMFHGWEKGKLPKDHQSLMAHAGLKAEEIYSPEGTGVLWDSQHKVARSDIYNTIHFATPLIEVPIDKVTPSEAKEYNDFRLQYLGLWRQYFDPIGIRVSQSDKQVRVQTYILPLIKNTEYNRLRRLTGGGTFTLDTSKFSPKTLAQFVAHIAPDAEERNWIGTFIDSKGLDWMGNWFMVRLDDSPIYAKLAELQVRRELDPEARIDFSEELRLLFQMPLTAGVEVRNPLVFAGALAALKKQITEALPDAITWENLEPKYKGVTLTRIKAKAGGEVAREFNRDEKEPFTPALYYALIDGGFYLSLSDVPLKEMIDRWALKKEGKLSEEKGETVKVNTSLYVAPQAAAKARDFLRFYLEWETHRRALANTPLLYSLYRCGLVAPDASTQELQAAAYRYLGFVPVSPDDAAYRYNAKTAEVINARHGSLRRPKLHGGVEASSPLGQLLEEFRTIRADLRFREDGVDTVVTLQRKKSKRGGE